GLPVVVGGDRVEQLREHVAVDAVRAFLDQAQAEMHVTEEPTLGGRREGGPATELERPADVVEERGGEQQIGAQARVELSGLAAERRHADRVLEEPARVRVVSLGGGEGSERGPNTVV